VVGTGRRLVVDMRNDDPRKFTVELRRIFNTQSLPAGAALRLRTPLPLTSDHLGNLEVHPHAVAAGAHVAVSRGRLEVRTQASDSGEVGATGQNPRRRGAGSSSGCSARSTPPSADRFKPHGRESFPEPLLGGRPNPK
jgi:hypothetical protein